MARTAGAGGKGIAAIGRRKPAVPRGDSSGISAASGRDVLTVLHAAPDGAKSSDPVAGVLTISLDVLAPHPHNPRESLGDLSELVESIRSVGVIQPLAVASVDAVLADDPDLAATIPSTAAWVIVAGHRRAEASRLAGRDTVEVIVRNDLADSVTTTQIFLIENLQRRGLDPLEEAAGYARLRRRGLSQRRIAEAVGVSQGQVSKRLGLLDLPTAARAAIAAGDLAASTALRLLDVPQERRETVLQRAQAPESHGLDSEVSRELTSREEADSSPSGPSAGPDPQPAVPPAQGKSPARSPAGEQESRDAARARLRACRRLTEKQLSPTQALEILADAVLAVDVHRAGARLRTLVQEWTGLTTTAVIGDASALTRAQTSKVAVATALAAFELEAVRSPAGVGGRWPPHIERYIRRLVDHGVHELSAYEARRLTPTTVESDSATR